MKRLQSWKTVLQCRGEKQCRGESPNASEFTVKRDGDNVIHVAIIDNKLTVLEKEKQSPNHAAVADADAPSSGLLTLQQGDISLFPRQVVERRLISENDLMTDKTLEIKRRSYSYDLAIAADRWGRDNGFATAFPTFKHTTGDTGEVFEVFGLRREWKADRWPSGLDMGRMTIDTDRLMSVDAYARQNGFVSGWPNWVELGDDGATRYGVYLFHTKPESSPSNVLPIKRLSIEAPKCSFVERIKWAQTWLADSEFNNEYLFAFVVPETAVSE